jgi:flagellar M-ring protein FliF
MVPGNLVHETRLKLASQGLPKGGTPGFELMDSPKFGITQFQEQVHYQRAIEGELAKSIQSLSAVRGARVHIALPKQSVFLKDTQKPTASVLVALYPGKTLERAQISGIMHLVSSSLPELSPRNVSVVDDSGNLLSPSADAGKDGQLDANQLSYVQRIEDSYNKRIVDILSPLYGEGNVRAQVKTDIDFSEAESTSEAFKPNQTAAEAAVRSMQVSEAPGGAGGASGVPGALSNQPGATPTAPLQGGAATNPGGAAPSAAQAGQKRDATTNYELDKTVRHVRSAAGSVRRVSAAVVVNHRKTGTGGKAQSSPLTPEELTQVNALVREAIGFQKDRGDSINVVNAPFSAVAPEAVPDLPLWKQPEVVNTAKELGKYALLAGLAWYLVFGLLRPAFRTLSTPVAADESQAPAEAAAGGQHPALPNHLDSARQIAKQDPRVVAQVVKNWAAGNE